MKKVLSFVLVLAMILGSVSMAFAADPALPFEDAPNSKVATILRDLGIIAGNSTVATESAVNLNTNITRAEFCKILMTALKQGAAAEILKSAVSEFKDVPADQWYTGYVVYANAMGFVDGYGNGQFGPLDNVTYDQATTMVLKMMGYSKEIVASTSAAKLTWPSDYQIIANNIGLEFETGTEFVTRDYAFDLLYQALKSGKYASYNPFTNTLSSNANGPFHADANAYSIDVAFIYEDTEGANEDLDLSAYVGKYVEVLLNGDHEIMAVLKESSEVVTEIEYTTAKVATTVGGVAISGAAANTPVIYRNGEELSKTSHDAISAVNTAAALAKGIDWKLEVVKSKDSKKVVKGEVKSAAYDIVDEVILVDAKLAASCAALATGTAFVNGKSLNLSAKDAIETVFRGVDSMADIAEGDILELYYNYDGSKVLIVNVVRDDVEDVLLKKVVSGKYTFDNGEVYEVGEYDIDVDALDDAKRFVSPMALKLDSNGDIVYATIVGITEAVPETTTGYAVVVYQGSDASHAYTSKGEVITTNNSIVLMPFGASEALTFENVSAAGLAGRDEWAANAKAYGAGKRYAEYCVSAAGKLLALTPAASIVGAQTVTSEYVAKGKVGSAFIASDVVIVKSTGTAAAAASNAAVFGTYAMADIEGQTISGFYLKNAVNAVKVLVVEKIENAVAPTDKTYSSPVALLSWTGEDADGIIVSYFDGEVKEAHATAGATGIDPASAGTTITSIYTVEFDKATGKITSVEAFVNGTVNLVAGKTTAKAITISAVAGSIEAVQYSVNGATPDVAYVDAPTVWVLTAKGFVAGTEETLAKNIAKYYTTSIDFYEVGAADGAYEFVVIR